MPGAENQNQYGDKAANMKRPARPLQQAEYNALAEFRYQLRKFLRHMEDEVRAEGLNPQQHQVLLAIKGLPQDRTATVGVIAERMQVNHNSMVELLDRCEQRNLLRRSRSRSDRRQVVLEITPEGDEVLCKLARAARKELSSVGKILVQSIEELIQQKSEVDDPE